MAIKKRFIPCLLSHCLLAVFVLLSAAVGSHADEKKPAIELKVNATKESVRLKDGKTVVEMLPVVDAVRGDTLLYTLTYRNTGQSSANSVVVVDQIPEGTVYLPESASGQNSRILFSINGGATYQEPPLLYKSRNASGTEVTLPASPEMYTHIKWIVQVPLKPGESGKAFFKVKVK